MPAVPERRSVLHRHADSDPVAVTDADVHTARTAVRQLCVPTATEPDAGADVHGRVSDTDGSDAGADGEPAALWRGIRSAVVRHQYVPVPRGVRRCRRRVRLRAVLSLSVSRFTGPQRA